MRIGINTLAVIPSEIGGTQTYLRKLIENLARIDRSNEYFLFVGPWNKDLFEIKQENFQPMMCNIPVKPLAIRVLYEQIILPFFAWKNKIDIFHFPANVSPFVLSCPSVLTIHDTCAFTIPELIPAILRQYWKIMVRSSARNANVVIAVSRSSKENIVRFLGISKEKIQVIYHGSEHQILEARGQNYSVSGQNEVGGHFPYVLWVGKLFSHKNLPRLLHAFAKLIETSKMKYRLVICGMRSWGYSPLVKTVKELGLQGRVIFKGYVPHNELKPIYNNACLFVFPSLIETFGLPILEAMSHGVPVVTSNYGAMAEIAGDAALLVDPYDVDEIVEAMHKVLTDENLRKDLIKKGLERAKQFSWEKTARETLSVYKKACGKE